MAQMFQDPGAAQTANGGGMANNRALRDAFQQQSQQWGQANAQMGTPAQPSQAAPEGASRFHAPSASSGYTNPGGAAPSTNPWQSIAAPSGFSGYTNPGGSGQAAPSDQRSAQTGSGNPWQEMVAPSGMKFVPQPGQSATSGAMQSLAQQFAQRASNFAEPNVTGMKAQAQNTIASNLKDQRNQAAMSAARRGTMQSGNLGAMERRLGDAATGNLTNALTNIDMQANQQGFQNNLGMTNAMQTLAGQLIGQDQFGQSHNLQAELGRRGANTADAQVNLQSVLGRGGLDLDERRFGEDTRRFNLQDQRQQEAAAAAASAARDRARQQEEYQRQQLANQTYGNNMDLADFIFRSL